MTNKWVILFVDVLKLLYSNEGIIVFLEYMMNLLSKILIKSILSHRFLHLFRLLSSTNYLVEIFNFIYMDGLNRTKEKPTTHILVLITQHYQ